MVRPALAGTGLTVLALVAAGSGRLSATGPPAPTGPVVRAAASTPELLTPAQTTFDTAGTGPWSGSDATLAGVPAAGSTGTLALTATSTGPMSAVSGSAAGGRTATRPGVVASASAALSAGTPRDAAVVAGVLGFYSSSGSTLAVVFGQAVTDGAGTWTRLPVVRGLAPAGTASVAFGLVAYTSSVGARLFVSSPSMYATPVPSTTVTGPLHTAGNELIDARGRPVVLHSLQLDGLEDAPNAPSVTQAAVASAQAWGANAVRVPLGQQFWLPSSCAYSSSYASTVDQVVHWITARHMIAVLDLDYSLTADACTRYGAASMADTPGSTTFWHQVAARYASNPLVVFDLFNEPHDISDATWLSGGPVTDHYTGERFQAAGMQQLLDAVRGVGARNVVVVSGNDWANTLPAGRPSGGDIVYGMHVYTCPGSILTACANPAPADPSPVMAPWVGPSASVPVAVTEFGWPSRYDGTYAANVIAYAGVHGWGFNAFDLSVDPIWGLEASGPPSGVSEPSPSGMPVLGAFVGAP